MTADHTTDIPLKRCSSKENCANPNGPFLPSTSDYFHRDKNEKSGYKSYCKACQKVKQQRWIENNPEEYRATLRRYRKTHPEKKKENQKKYAAKHPEQVRKWRLRYAEKTREIKKLRSKEYYQNNKEKHLLRCERWRKNNPDKSKAQFTRRMARKRALPSTFTGDNWQEALRYFNGKCAACGRSEGLWHTLAADHWIPLSAPDCPGTIPTNIIPLCQSKKGDEQGCNNLKGNKDPQEWLIGRFGASKGKQILKRIQDYFDSLKK